MNPWILYGNSVVALVLCQLTLKDAPTISVHCMTIAVILAAIGSAAQWGPVRK